MTVGNVATALLLQVGLLLQPAMSQQMGTKPVITPEPAATSPAQPATPTTQKAPLIPIT